MINERKEDFFKGEIPQEEQNSINESEFNSEESDKELNQIFGNQLVVMPNTQNVEIHNNSTSVSNNRTDNNVKINAVNSNQSNNSNYQNNNFNNYINYSLINYQKIVIITGTVTNIRVGKTKRGNGYVSLRISVYKSSNRLRSVWQGNTRSFPDEKYSSINVVAYNDKNIQNATFVYNMHLKASQFNNGKLTQAGDQVTVVGYRPTANIYTSQNGKKYYNYNLNYLNIFRNEMTNGVRPLMITNAKKGRNWVVLMRGKLSSLPRLCNTQNGKQFSAMQLCIQNDPRVYQALHAITNDQQNLLPQHNAESPYFINITAWNSGKDYVLSQKWQKNDLVEVLGVVAGLKMPKDVEHEPQVNMFVNSIRKVNLQKKNTGSVDLDNIPNPWDNDSDSNNVQIDLDETGLIH